MIVERPDVTFSQPNMANIFPYPQQLGVNTVGWFSADQNVALSGNNVLSWIDRTKNAIKVVNTGSPFPVVYVPNAQNGLPGLVTSQTSSANPAYLVSPTTVPALDLLEYNTPWSITIAFKSNTFSGALLDQFPVGYGRSDTLTGWALNTRLQNVTPYIWQWTVYDYAVAVANQNRMSGTPQPPTTAAVTFVWLGSPIPSGSLVYLNGVLNSTIDTTITQSLQGPQRLLRFFSAHATKPSPDMIFEVVMNNIALTQAQALLMDQYLNKKWNLHI